MQYSAVVGDDHWIREVRDHGRSVILEDGSCWEIEPDGTISTSIWLPASEIEVLHGDDPSYPYKLANKDENELVDAKYVGRC